MFAKLVGMGLVAASCLIWGFSADAQDQKKKRSGTLTGEIKSQKKTPNGKNTIIEVLAPGEEKARFYRVLYDPKAKGPIPDVLEAVRAAKIGDRVQLEWVDTGEGLAIKSFHVLTKKKGDEHKEHAKDLKKRSGTIIGTLKSQKNTKDGKNTIIEVLAPGEEKARSYHVLWDSKIKGPIPSVLAAVRAAKVEDRVEFEWVETGHGPAIRSFQVVKKGARGEK